MKPQNILRALHEHVETYRSSLSTEQRISFDLMAHNQRHVLLYGHDVWVCGDVEHNPQCAATSRQLRS